MTRLEALAHGQAPAAEAPCCPFHATGGHPEDRHGFDPASVVYGPALSPTPDASGSNVGGVPMTSGSGHSVPFANGVDL